MPAPLPRAARRLLRPLAVAGLALVVTTSTAQAQLRAAPAGVATGAPAPSAFTLETRASVRADVIRVEDRYDRVFDHTIGGALVGVAAGAAYALVLTSNSGDDSEDGLAYIVLMPLGAVVGAVVGTVVGLVRTQ